MMKKKMEDTKIMIVIHQKERGVIPIIFIIVTIVNNINNHDSDSNNYNNNSKVTK